jgi:hypothetical protein
VIVLDPDNPYDFTDNAIEVLCVGLSREFDTSLRVDRRDERGQGVTLVEILHVWMDIGSVASTGLLVTRLGAWLLARRQKEAQATERPRPRTANLWGPKGECLKTVIFEGDEAVIKDPGGPHDEWSRPRPRPPSVGSGPA